MTNRTILITKTGKHTPVDDSAAPIKDPGGSTVGCVVVFRDSTKEREVDRAKSEFISVASHQLRTPLTGIKWYVEMLRDAKINNNLTDDQHEMIKSVHESTERMITLVNDLLNVSRIETGRKFNIRREKRDLVPIINKVIDDVDVIAQARDITLSVTENFPKTCLIWIDEDKMKEVITNLVGNAVKYSKPGGTVELGFDENEMGVNISVKDHGVGIPEKSQQRIFQKFYRGSNTTNETEGTGLGLYIARVIVEGHGGYIGFHSKENEGTTFYISLPKGSPKKESKNRDKF